MKRKHTKAASERIETSLDTPDSLKSNPCTISAQELCAWTGLSDRRHRQLAKEGFFPPPIKGEYQMLPAIIGLLKYFRTMGEKYKAKLAENAEKISDIELEERTIKLGSLKGEFRSAKEIADSLFALGEEIKSTLSFKLIDQLPQLNDGLGAIEQRANNKKAYLEILKRFQDWAQKWKA